MKNLVLALVLFGTASALTACNTISGLGEDVKTVGEATSDASHAVQGQMGH